MMNEKFILIENGLADLSAQNANECQKQSMNALHAIKKNTENIKNLQGKQYWTATFVRINNIFLIFIYET